MSALPFSASAPRYQQLTDTLVREIASGRFPVGSLLPPEPQLCQRFGVSRHTVREAVRRLAEMGLVSRRQGVGTHVKSVGAQTRYVASLSSLQDLMQYTQHTRLKRLGERWVEADPALARLLRCKDGQRWLEFDTCRYPEQGDVPLVHMRVYVPPEYERIRDDLGDGTAWIYGLVEKHSGERIVEAEQMVGAISIPADSARVLGVKPRTPGLLVRRYYLGRNDRLLSVSLNVYPADRFELATRWRLEFDEPTHGEPAERAEGGDRTNGPSC